MMITKKVDNEKLAEIKKELIKLNMKPNLKGIEFWAIAIYIVRNNKEQIKMEYIYKEVAEYFKTTYSKAERNMRYSLSLIEDEVKNMYKFDSKIDNKTFLALNKYINIDIGDV